DSWLRRGSRVKCRASSSAPPAPAVSWAVRRRQSATDVIDEALELPERLLGQVFLAEANPEVALDVQDRAQEGDRIQVEPSANERALVRHVVAGQPGRRVPQQDLDDRLADVIGAERRRTQLRTRGRAAQVSQRERARNGD